MREKNYLHHIIPAEFGGSNNIANLMWIEPEYHLTNNTDPIWDLIEAFTRAMTAIEIKPDIFIPKPKPFNLKEYAK